MTAKLKAYLAGPDVFRADPNDHFRARKAEAARFGVLGLSPLDNDATDPIEIYEANCAMIRRCDFVLANIEPFRGVSVDAGTAFEIGYASALRKPVVLYTDNSEVYRDRAQNHTDLLDESFQYPTIEDFKLTDNLMIALAGPIFPSFMAALTGLKYLRLK